MEVVIISKWSEDCLMYVKVEKDYKSAVQYLAKEYLSPNLDVYDETLKNVTIKDIENWDIESFNEFFGKYFDLEIDKIL